MSSRPSTRGSRDRISLAVAVCDFGWGSLGKCRLILDRLGPTDVTLVGHEGIRHVVRTAIGTRHSFVDRSPTDADVALVINDPAGANTLGHLGVPVVYVDSLPYLWMTDDEIPQADIVTHYCAQKFPPGHFPVSAPLCSRNHIQWIEPIVPRPARRRGGRGVVVNLGGLHSHLVGDAAQAYIRLALFPLIEVLIRSRKRVLAVCGNLSGAIGTEIRALLPEVVHIGGLSPYDFDTLLRDADLLITSPGSTTILQAASLRLPLALMPPQNLSQMMNARLFADSSVSVVSWPASIVDPDRVEALRPLGEDAVLAYVYGAICDAAAAPQPRREMAQSIGAFVESIPDGRLLEPSLAALGSNGARQVAQLVRQVALAPPRP